MKERKEAFKVSTHLHYHHDDAAHHLHFGPVDGSRIETIFRGIGGKQSITENHRNVRYARRNRRF